MTFRRSIIPCGYSSDIFGTHAFLWNDLDAASPFERGDPARAAISGTAKAELCRRVGQMDEAKASFEKALALTSQEQQRRFLERPLAEIKAAVDFAGFPRLS